MSKIVSIHSYRGGTGKSNLSANLSTQLALRNKRVAVVDTDLQSPGIHILFGLDEEEKPYKTLNDFLWGNCEVEDTAFDAGAKLRERHGEAVSNLGGLYLIPSSIKSGEIARILREGYDVAMLNDGFQSLIERLDLDYLFIDTHPGVNEETLLSMAISDYLILVVRPDRQDFQGTAVTIEVARKLQVPNMLLVMNKMLSGMRSGGFKEDIQKTFGATVAGMLPFSEDMIRLGSSDIFSIKHTDHPFTKEIHEIAAQLLD